ncbi:MAG TPA: oxygen-independent coproporphyrinogen III oxidase [Steroidobacteraceae bacterium]|jgi:oxygen-independent coproporphyrinogen-3 oxidase|nr:oxygen-independent coproporphyrinogen III oxidase [Steroidobacteraceae bacterium]
MKTAPFFAAAALRKYDLPGPRYTSYPTAPHFGPHFDEAMLREYIRCSNAEPIPRELSLYVHVPYCFSPCFYCGCNRIITYDRSKGRKYVDRLIREIAMVGGLFDRDREVVQLHFGGGTPNFLEPREMREVLAAIGSHFHLGSSPRRDFSIELDPRYVADGYIAALTDLGFNRASLGVQDFDPDVQRAVNRLQSVEQTERVIDECRAAGWRSANIDLIYGLPKQTRVGFEGTLDTVLRIRPDRLAVYSYAHMPRMFRAQRQIDAADLPSAEDKLGLLQLSIEKLSAAGYAYIGMDHFALPDDELARAQAGGTLHRNFMGYTTHADCDLVGLGVSAVSHIGDSYSQNARDLPAWETAIDQGRLPVWRGRHLDFDDVLRADVIQQLMCLGSIDRAAVERRHEIDFRTYFADTLARLRPLAADGLVTVDEQRIAATSRGRLLLRIIAMCFDRYLNECGRDVAAPRFSRAI